MADSARQCRLQSKRSRGPARCGQHSPGSHRRGLLFRTPCAGDCLPERFRGGANVRLRLVHSFGRADVEAPPPPHKTSKAAVERRVLDDASKETPLERMDSNMCVAEELGVDRAPHDHTSAYESVSGRVLLNHVSERMRSKAAHGMKQAREPGAIQSGSAETRMVRLTRFGNRRVAQVNSAAIQDARGLTRAADQHSRRPTGFDGEADRRSGLTCVMVHDASSEPPALYYYCCCCICAWRSKSGSGTAAS